MIKFFGLFIPVSLITKTCLEFIILFLSIPIGCVLVTGHAAITLTFWVGFLYAMIVYIIMVSFGLYNRHLRENFKGSMLRAIVVFGLAFFIMSSVFYTWPELAVSRKVFLYAVLFSLVGLLITRTACFYVQKHNLLYRRRILVYGAGHRANLISQLKRDSDQRNFNCVGFIALPDEAVKIEESKIIPMPEDLFAYVEQNYIDEIIVALDDKRKALPIRDLLDCKVAGVEIIELAHFFEKHTGRIKLQSVHPSHLVFANGFTRNNINLRMKRLIDLISALILLSVTWPIMLITALAIMIESGFKGSIFYHQTRVGQHNTNFDVIKFRSMSMNAEKNGAQWATKNDSRVTVVGNFIRKVRIDELPQLLNVIKGEMSFVGPRPERPTFVNDFSKNIEFYEIRHFVKPGLTGWAQICYPYGSTEEDTKNKLEFDLYYLKNYSLFLDMMIILQTIQVVLWRQGSR